MSNSKKSFDDFLDQQLYGAKQHKKNQMLKEERAKFRDADDICYGNSYKIRKQNNHAKGR
jgi:hypothetical protein